MRLLVLRIRHQSEGTGCFKAKARAPVGGTGCLFETIGIKNLAPVRSTGCFKARARTPVGGTGCLC